VDKVERVTDELAISAIADLATTVVINRIPYLCRNP